jgi:hypothetical protein
MVRSLLCAAFLLLAAILPASAQSVPLGTYNGTIKSGDAEVPVETVFSGKGTQVTGKYVIEDPASGTYEGTITNLLINASRVATLTWTDKFGEGTAIMAFSEDGRSFSGKWYFDGQLGGIWNGTRAP